MKDGAKSWIQLDNLLHRQPWEPGQLWASFHHVRQS